MSNKTSESAGISLWTLISTALICVMVGIFIGSTLLAPKPPAPAPAMASADLPPGHPPLTNSESGASNSGVPGLNFDSPEVRAQIATAPDAKSLDIIGDRQFDQGHPRLAIAAYERAIALGEHSPDVLTDLGSMYRAEGRTDDAIREFRKAAALDPKHANSRFNLGTVLFDKGDVAAGVKAWEEYLKLDPNGTKAQMVRDHLKRIRAGSVAG